MQNQIVRCDECGRGTKINLKERKYGQGRREAYFTCEHCDHKYTSYVTDTRVRRWQVELNETTDAVQRFNLQLKIRERMQKLKTEL
ncbi:hypothetical protein [Alkalihalobacterium alkalinitrilicum]|uniref:hypothetical protein n=1 Tax=Alkalihalobacterium alkalinitrilicum TaxID=427920 RepID=UPI0009957BF6|nr:hypothetical protein [Alkalihalobacterium alkalinitrilicum]